MAWYEVWYWVVVVVVGFIGCFLGVYFDRRKKRLEDEFKTLFGVWPFEEKSVVEAAVRVKTEELALNWEKEIEKTNLGRKTPGLTKAEEAYEQAARLAHRFRILGW